MKVTSSSESSKGWPARIGLVTDYYPPGRPGGVGEVASELCTAYRRLGKEVRVITAGASHQTEEGVIRLGWGPSALGAASPFLPHLLRGVDLIHIHQASVPGLYLAKTLLAGGVAPILTTIHCSTRELIREVRTRRVGPHTRIRPALREYLYKHVTGPLHFISDRIAIKLSDAVTAVCQSCLVECRRAQIRPPGGLWRVPNGVDIDRFRPGSGGRQVRERYGLGGDLVLLYVGTFRIWKGIHDLIPIVQAVSRSRPDVRLLVVGGGRGIDSDLRKLARQFGVAERLVLAGFVENADLPPYYDASDIVLLPSYTEGLPLALLEAMAAGRPTVASRVGGVHEVVLDGQTGYTVRSGDWRAMARRVELLARSRGTRMKMGQAARKRAGSLYSWDTVARSYLSISSRLRERAR